MKKLKEVSLFEKINKLSAERDKVLKTFNKRIEKIELELKSICTHSETTTREQNYAGGYLDRAEYNTITECKFCDTELDRVTTTGGYG